MIALSRKLKRTHDLLELLDEVIIDAPELARFEVTCIKITEYYTEHRYLPLVTSELSRDEVLKSLAEATEIIEEIKQRIDLS